MSGQFTIVQINPPESVIRKIIVGYDQSDYVTSFQLFDTKGSCVLVIGTFSFFGEQTKEILLEAEDRIVGIRSRLHEANKALHTSLVIVIARRTA